MNTKEALNLVDAIQTIATATGEEFVAVASRITFMDDARARMIREAIALQNAFVDAGIVERGAMLGIEITQSQGGFQTEAQL